MGQGPGQEYRTPATGTVESTPGTTSVTPAPDPAQEALASQIQAIIDGQNWAAAEWSVLAVSLDTGDTLFARAPERPLAPASNVKLLTTAAALHYLGPGYRFRTFLIADGPIRDGVLDGNVVLYGTGDPSLSDRFFGTGTAILERLAEGLVAAGIHHITGDVVGDGTLLPGRGIPADWDPGSLNDWYAAPATALAFNENVFRLRVAAEGEGSPPTVETVPADAGLPVSNQAVTSRRGTRNRLAVVRAHPDDSVTVVGEIPQGSRDVWRQLTVADPETFAATAMKRVIEEAGISVEGQARRARDLRESPIPQDALWAPGLVASAGPTILASHDSPPLIDLLEVVNKESHNLYAELIFRTIGLQVSGDGSYRGGAEAVEAFLVQEVGIAPDQVHLTDGSGLSPTNRVSAGAFVRTLEFMAQSPYWPAFWSTLPEAGNPRELRRMYRTRAAGNLRAKTGTIERTSSLSGLVRSAAGERILFSILANEVPSTTAAKRLEDRIGTRLADFDRSFQPLPDRTEVARDADGTPELRAQNPRHRVRSGENLTVIARRYGVSLDDLLQANPGVDRRPLQPGQVLTIPR
jgi:D-alanyl-D-alanine carboxypeptidase/D-alanyl-D-alanine-endopeptidase (penicillin-binding protein 4)